MLGGQYCVCDVTVNAVKAYGLVVQAFLTSALNVMSGQLPALAALVPGKLPRYPVTRRMGGSRTGLDALEKR